SPSHVTRSVMRDALPSLPRATPIVCATKGIENDSLLTMYEVLEDVLPPEMHPYICCLSGPSFAKETVARMPTAVVVASPWEKMAQRVQRVFSNDYFRVYTSIDVAGVELGGSLKNVCAIAAGISDGMGFGNNTRAAIMTRGLAELVRLAVKKGANPLTLSGLAGMGDLVLTCTGELSRNRTVGLGLGRGQSLQEVLAGMSQIAEGVRTAKSVHDLSHKLGVDMPLHEAIYRILYENLTPKAALQSLSSRELKSEFQLH
ncbi:MAG TPA: NAD(P)H-dependent glycerol-3-phosphate dehydrogenase, partial [Myxococcales bacterium]